MEKEEQERVRAAIREILAVAELNEVTERKVRELASEKTGIDLSASRERKGFVANVIRELLESRSPASDAEAEDSKPSPEDQKPGVREAFRDSSSKKRKTEEMEDIKKKEDDSDQEYEGDEEEARGGGERPQYETDEEGNYIICELSGKRKVVVSQWRGKTLISIREYYEKDGKELPSSKGISLTAEQFELLAKSTSAVARAISSMD